MKYIGLVVGIITSVFILRELLIHINQIQNFIITIGWLNILTSAIFYFGYFYCRAFSWNLILKSLGANHEKRDSIFAWFIGEATRYVPGNVWSFASRFYLTSRKKVPKLIIGISMIIEILVILIVTFILSIYAITVHLDQLKNLQFIYVLVAMVGISFAVLLFTFSNKFKMILKKINEVPPSIFLNYNFILAILFQIFAWLLYGLANYALLQPFNNIGFFIVISNVLLAWLIGYLSFISPSGLVVREGALILLLAPTIGNVSATLVAILSRIILIVVELINVIIWIYIYKKTVIKQIITRVIKNWDLLILSILITSYVVILSRLSILRHEAFASNFDLANMSQTVWNTLHGRPFALSGAEGNISRFSIHADLILIILSPLYFIWERAITLLVIQSLVVGLGGIPVYYLSKKVFSSLKNINPVLFKILPLVLVLVYLLNPAMEWSNLYDFHGITLAIPMLIAAFYFAYVKKWRLYWLFVFLVLTTKEEVSLMISLLGLFMLFFYKERLRGLITFLIGILWFSIMVFWLIPHFSANSAHWAVNSLYSTALQKFSVSHNLSEVLDVLRGYFLNDTAISYYIDLLKPFAFLPLLGLPWLLLSSPEFAINLMSTDPQMQTLTFHYDAGITPFLMIATIFGLKYLLTFFWKIKISIKYKNFTLAILLIILVGIALRINYHYSPLPTTPSCWCLSYQVSQDDKEFAQILNTIPMQASVASSGEIRAHLTKRENSFTLPGGVNTADYVAILDQNRIVGDYSPKEYENQLIKDAEFLSTHKLLSHIGHFYLFQKR